ncbi:MAG TPA: Eco57I restriction-modification methylase domain-containing protein, partial [bacterium]|nr:Eco57I restriction-modification methylase domain-containing protein [bacterium]
MPINRSRAKTYIREFQFTPLFIEELGWDRCSISHTLTVGENTYQLNSIAEKCGLVVFHCLAAMDKEIPDYSTRRKIEKDIAKFHHEHLIVFSDAEQTFQIWQWIRREPGRPDACREHRFGKGQPGESLVQKLEQLAFTFEQEEAGITLFDVTDPVRRAFDVDRVTKKFYDRFKKEHDNFQKFITGIEDITELNWYTSIMLNRLMFVYFIQEKGFLDGDKDYLRNRLQRCRKELGKGKFQTFYRYFLIRLFHEGFGQREKDRDPKLRNLLGKVPFLNGGLFDVHQLEESHPDLDIPDEAFSELFDFFKDYHWHLDERPLRADNEINPDVLGYIFEKYINQKQMGAYYTKEDITEYIGKNTIVPFLFDAARAKCKIAFEGDKAKQGQDSPIMPTVWDLLKQDPDRYIYEAVRLGVIDEKGKVVPESVLPDFVRTGMNDPKARMFDQRYNLWKAELRDPKEKELTLPTETWREYVNRRRRCLEIRKELRSGEVREINDLITLNLNIRQFAQDVLADCDSPDLLRAFWKAIEKVTILDPTCGSGAFLFAALNILEPLYETCLQRMEAFIEDLERSGKKHRPEKFSDFRDILKQVKKHPNHRYFILKSIILNNLYGVDIMAEAVEICKLRLFLKLAAQVDPDYSHDNLGLEPLPDIDFNIRCGNTLVGFAKFSDFENAGSGKLDFDNAKQRISVRAADVQQAFDVFRSHQMESDGSVPIEDKQDLHRRLKALEEDLNRWLAGEYGVDPENGQEYEQWLKSHQPFHWFIEFHGIMKDGGFDVIIGNPPYVEYSKVKDDYEIKGYKTEVCGNLYALCIERSHRLLHSDSRFGFIVQQPVTSTIRMASCRDFVLETSIAVWASTFDDRPSKLFDGMHHARLAIVITKIGSSNSRDHTLFVTS